MSILIIGSSGFIGVDLCNSLVDNGHNVVCMDVSPNKIINSPSVELVQGDVTDYSYLSDLISTRNVDKIVNLSAIVGGASHKYPTKAVAVNCMGFDNVLRASVENEVSRVVWTSTYGIYGKSYDYPDGHIITEDSKPLPSYYRYPEETLYAATKQLNEHQSLVYATNHNLSVHGIRPSLVFGPGRLRGYVTSPGRKFMWTAELVQKAVAGEECIIDLSPDDRLNMVYVNDAVRLMSLILDSKSPSHPVYNTGGHSISIRDLSELIEDITGTPVSWKEDAKPWGRPPVVSHARAAEDFGYDITPLRESIIDYIDRL